MHILCKPKLKLKRQKEEADLSSAKRVAGLGGAISIELKMEALKSSIEEKIKSTHVLVYCKTTCPFCTKVSRSVDKVSVYLHRASSLVAVAT